MKLILNALLILLLLSCAKKPEAPSEETPISSDTEMSGWLVADTIIYDVVIQSTNPDDEWENQRLQYVNHSAFIDSLFDLVYNKELIAYDVFENKALTVSEVKSIERQSDYSRDRIGKIQFAEKWYFNSSSQELQKQLLSIALGYETYDEDGGVRAYKPVFKLFFH